MYKKIRIPPLCEKHYNNLSPTFIYEDGSIITACFTFVKDFSLASIFPDADVCLCAKVAVKSIETIKVFEKNGSREGVASFDNLFIHYFLENQEWHISIHRIPESIVGKDQ